MRQLIRGIVVFVGVALVMVAALCIPGHSWVVRQEGRMNVAQGTAPQPSAGQRHARRIYFFSIIPGGAYSAGELTAARKADPIIGAHYRGFGANVKLHILDHDVFMYVSYRIGDKPYWTQRKHRIPAGEEVLDDGRQFARARCGNRLSPTSQQPTAPKNEPVQELLSMSEPAFDAPPFELGDVPISPLDADPLAMFGGLPLVSAYIRGPSQSTTTTGASPTASQMPDDLPSGPVTSYFGILGQPAAFALAPPAAIEPVSSTGGGAGIDSPIPVASPATPEPGTGLLLTLGFAGLLVFLHRRVRCCSQDLAKGISARPASATTVLVADDLNSTDPAQINSDSVDRPDLSQFPTPDRVMTCVGFRPVSISVSELTQSFSE